MRSAIEMVKYSTIHLQCKEDTKTCSKDLVCLLPPIQIQIRVHLQTLFILSHVNGQERIADVRGQKDKTHIQTDSQTDKHRGTSTNTNTHRNGYMYTDSQTETDRHTE